VDLVSLHGQELLDQALDRLRAVLGQGWDVAPLPWSQERRIDAVWAVRSDDGSHGEIVVEVKSSLSPNDAVHLAAQLDSLGVPAGQPVLAVSPWLSPRTREVLERRGLGYLDLTGNVLLKLARPAIFIKTHGAVQNPVPQRRGRRGLSGPRSGLLVRELVDFAEPRRANELAAAAGISEGYVSRLLDSLSDEALIRRGKDRLITNVDWRGLLRARAATYQLLKANHVAPALARQGRARLLDDLREGTGQLPVIATGSLAAQAFAPTTIGGALMLYVPPGSNVAGIAKELGLLRIDQSADADVLLLQPVYEGTLVRPHPELIDGIECVGLSQLVLDCLTGPGRMPAEGEAVLAWMGEREEAWRRPSPLTGDDGVLP
jgi:hypothetical protein